MKKQLSAGGFLILLLTLVASTILDGWALRIMWGWFVVPTFHVPTLPLPIAIGITLIISLLAMRPSAISATDPDGQAVQAFTWAIMKPLFTLGIAWIVTLFL